jgi:hypothetical protein
LLQPALEAPRSLRYRAQVNLGTAS